MLHFHTTFRPSVRPSNRPRSLTAQTTLLIDATNHDSINIYLYDRLRPSCLPPRAFGWCRWIRCSSHTHTRTRTRTARLQLGAGVSSTAPEIRSLYLRAVPRGDRFSWLAVFCATPCPFVRLLQKMLAAQSPQSTAFLVARWGVRGLFFSYDLAGFEWRRRLRVFLYAHKHEPNMNFLTR